jgi:hypothetical protein
MSVNITSCQRGWRQTHTWLAMASGMLLAQTGWCRGRGHFSENQHVGKCHFSILRTHLMVLSSLKDNLKCFCFPNLLKPEIFKLFYFYWLVLIAMGFKVIYSLMHTMCTDQPLVINSPCSSCEARNEILVSFLLLAVSDRVWLCSLEFEILQSAGITALCTTVPSFC